LKEGVRSQESGVSRRRSSSYGEPRAAVVFRAMAGRGREFRIQNSEFGNLKKRGSSNRPRDPKPATIPPRPEIRDPRPSLRDPRPATRDHPSATRDHILVAIVGPTASGKSTLAMRLALELGGEIVNCDSMQMIRQLKIGTDKPSPEDRARVKHHLFDRIDVDEFYSAGMYMKEARAVCREIASRKNIPIVVGGTGLYFRALTQGIFEGPGKSERLRERLEKIIKRRGLDFLYDKLKSRDPESASRLEPGDRVRIVRALEIHILTGLPISRIQKEARPLTGFQLAAFGLNPPRERLYDRINRRVEEMFQIGLLEEVLSLVQAGYPRGSKGFEALGYRYAFDVLENAMTMQEAIELTQRDTRRYAKRQMTWFRREKGIYWILGSGDSEESLRTVLREIGKRHEK